MLVDNILTSFNLLTLSKFTILDNLTLSKLEALTLSKLTVKMLRCYYLAMLLLSIIYKGDC